MVDLELDRGVVLVDLDDRGRLGGLAVARQVHGHVGLEELIGERSLTHVLRFAQVRDLARDLAFERLEQILLHLRTEAHLLAVVREHDHAVDVPDLDALHAGVVHRELVDRTIEDLIAHPSDRSPEVLGDEEGSDHALGDQFRAHRGRLLGAGSQVARPEGADPDTDQTEHDEAGDGESPHDRGGAESLGKHVHPYRRAREAGKSRGPACSPV